MFSTVYIGGLGYFLFYWGCSLQMSVPPPSISMDGLNVYVYIKYFRSIIEYFAWSSILFIFELELLLSFTSAF